VLCSLSRPSGSGLVWQVRGGTGELREQRENQEMVLEIRYVGPVDLGHTETW
jgi:hypothetical protein